ncbi:MAG: 6-bladed beta-propeller [Gemmatimonadetes bacterium]|nr:6-bladed beta-propeller [Gemmatimonadota bacterium]MCY3943750.1 6-bladed beta-propeller [Gemmatimonadota bacterium]
MENVADEWTVEEQPVAVLGRSGEVIGSEFAYVVDVALAPDGSIVVADQERGRISVHTAEGHVIQAFGGIGEGPEEFARVARVVVDSRGRLFVFDEGRQRLSEWTLDGRLVDGRRVGYREPGRMIGDVGQFASGAWYAREADRMLGAEVDGVARDTVGFVTLGEGFVVDERLTDVQGAMATQFLVEGMPMMRHALLTPRPIGVAIGECLVVGTSEAPSLEIVHRRGGKKGRLLLEVEVSPSGRATRREWIENTLAGIVRVGGEPEDIEVRMIEEIGNSVRMARSIPFAHAIVLDALGYIWTQDYQLPEGAGSGNWRVITESGESIGTVKLPKGLRVMAITEREIIAVGENADGLEEVRIYRMDRGSVGEARPVPSGCRPDRKGPAEGDGGWQPRARPL